MSARLNQVWAQLLIEELIRHQLDYFCLSPGSRSTSLTAAVARHPQAHSTVFYDERSAAFHALGYARAREQAAVLICTSGSALAHYLPAVIEAAQDQIPLLILSADRPPELLEIGANQTIRQSGLYGNYVRWFSDLPAPQAEISPVWLLRSLDQAVYATQQGPVHLNLHFREPFFETASGDLSPLASEPEQSWPELPASLTHWQQSKLPLIQQARPQLQLSQVMQQGLLQALQASQRGVLLVGRLRTLAEQAAVLRLAQALQWPVFADPLSGLRLSADLPQIDHYDLLLKTPTLREPGWQPDCVLQIGQTLVSKTVLSWLETLPADVPYYLLSDSEQRQDPALRQNFALQVDLVIALPELISRLSPKTDSALLAPLQAAASQARETLRSAFADPAQAGPLTEPRTMRELVNHLPEEYFLMLGNSMPVRDFDMFVASRGRAQVVFGNRGCSGIDGQVSTLSGLIQGRQQPGVLICGDLTLFHDLNALYQLPFLPQQAIVVVINNQGGGIFSLLPVQQQTDIFETYFGTPHCLRFEAAATLFGLEYAQVQMAQDFVPCWQAMLKSGRAGLIEVSSERAANAEGHRLLQAAITQAIASQSAAFMSQ